MTSVIPWSTVQRLWPDVALEFEVERMMAAVRSIPRIYVEPQFLHLVPDHSSRISARFEKAGWS